MKIISEDKGFGICSIDAYSESGLEVDTYIFNIKEDNENEREFIICRKQLKLFLRMLHKLERELFDKL